MQVFLFLLMVLFLVVGGWWGEGVVCELIATLVLQNCLHKR